MEVHRVGVVCGGIYVAYLDIRAARCAEQLLNDNSIGRGRRAFHPPPPCTTSPAAQFHPPGGRT